MTGVRRFAQWGLWFGGALVLLAAVLIGIDVLMRKFLDPLDRRRRRACRLCAGDRDDLGTGRGAARSCPHPHRFALRPVPAEAAPGARSRGPRAVHRLLRPDLVAWLRRRLAVLDFRLAQPVRARNTDHHPAVPLDRRTGGLCRGRRWSSSSRRSGSPWPATCTAWRS